MSTLAAGAPGQRCTHRAVLFTLFLLFQAAVFLPSQVISQNVHREIEVAILIWALFSALTVILYRAKPFREYWPVFFSYTLASLALLLIWVVGDHPLRWLQLSPSSAPGIAISKLSDALVGCIPIIVLAWLFGTDLRCFYLQRGRLKMGLVIGLIAFATMGAIGVVEARSLGVGMARIIHWIPWILVFVLANGFMEEFLLRAIFLRRYEPFLGRNLSNLATALVFAIGHSWVTYSSDLPVLLALAFAFGLIAGYLMQRTEAIWASALFHAGADTLIVLGMFAGVKT